MRSKPGLWLLFAVFLRANRPHTDRYPRRLNTVVYQAAFFAPLLVAPRWRSSDMKRSFDIG